MFAGMRGFQAALLPSARARYRAERAAAREARRRRATARTLRKFLSRVPFAHQAPPVMLDPKVRFAIEDDLRAALRALEGPGEVPASAVDELAELLRRDRYASPLWGQDAEAALEAVRRVRQELAPVAEERVEEQAALAA